MPTIFANVQFFAFGGQEVTGIREISYGHPPCQCWTPPSHAKRTDVSFARAHEKLLALRGSIIATPMPHPAHRRAAAKLAALRQPPAFIAINIKS